MSEPPPPALPPDPPLPATVGRYEVVRQLGEGAMGRVLLAHDPVLDRDVAVKHLRGDLKIPREVRLGLVARMRHEARAAARVAHPNLVVLHDMGEDAAVGLYLVFEYVAGPTLKQRLHEIGRLTPREAGRLAGELGAALAVAHEAGILHRDIKPENVMLSRTGGKIADFGIARIPDSTLTHQGGLMGTPAYSAPETFRGGKFSPASDQFSLGALIYEALSGQRAFPGDDAITVAARIANETPPPFAAELGLPPAVDDVLARALDRRPGERFPTCDAFGAALLRSLSLPSSGDLASAMPAGSVAAGSVPPPAPVPPGAARRRSLSEPPAERRTGQVVLGALLVVATAALVVRAMLLSSQSGADFTQPAPAPPASTVSVHTERPRSAMGVVPPVAPLPHRTRPRAEPSAAPTASADVHGAPTTDAGAAPAVPPALPAPPAPPTASADAGP